MGNDRMLDVIIAMEDTAAEQSKWRMLLDTGQYLRLRALSRIYTRKWFKVEYGLQRTLCMPGNFPWVRGYRKTGRDSVPSNKRIMLRAGTKRKITV
jgi:hypothetical protein